MIALLSALLAILPLGVEAKAAESANVLVIVVGKDSLLTNIPFNQLRRLFMAEISEIDGQRMLPFNYEPGNDIRVVFDKMVLKMDPDAVGRYWVDRLIRGQGKAPPIVRSPELACAVVGKLKGAIVYLPIDKVNDSVRVISVNGKMPKDQGYPLR
ncbi:MAG: hypothetical protein JW841_01490 [Deltaproteobacteria bacterium]|nr:hypothetical protein [Deltaproteobacteria bacterium]